VDDTQQTSLETVGDTNVMSRVLGSFDGIVENATTFIGSAAGSAKDAGAELVENAGKAAGPLGKKATGAASDIGAVIGENFDAAVTFAKGLFGG